MNHLSPTESFKDKWIEALALDEINMEESGVVNFNGHLDHQHLLEESSINFVDTIKEKFEIFVDRFNIYRGGMNQGTSIKVFKISNTVNDFMLYRSSLKLVVARKANDVVSIGFLSNTGGLYAARLGTHEPAANETHDIKAHIGPFGKITWRFQGEVVDVDCMVKHYLSEFIKHTAR